jgi:hypothetical protein
MAMNRKMLGFSASLVAGLFCLTTSLGQAAVIDDFSSSTAADIGNYNYFVAFNPLGNSPTPNVFNNSGGNFIPNMRQSETNIWLRNTGQQLVNVGDKVSIDINLNTTNNYGGIFLSHAVGSLSSGLEFDMNRSGWANGTGDASFVSASPSGFATMTITKTSATTYQAVLSGGGLSGNWTQTTTAGPVYFGMDQYSGNGPVGVPMANLAQSAFGNNQISFVDHFNSAASAANYSKVDAYNGGPTVLTTGSGATITGTGNSTTYYLRDSGQQFQAGDTLSLTFTTPISSFKGLGFAQSLSGASPFELFINSGGQTEGALTGVHSLGALSPSTADPMVITVSRGVGALGNEFSYSISGGGLSSPFTGLTTFGTASAAYYFGLGEYNGIESFSQLQFIGTPEPGSMTLLAAGAVGLLGVCGYGRRRQGKGV